MKTQLLGHVLRIYSIATNYTGEKQQSEQYFPESAGN
jgi:hypothetical protein